MKKRRSVRTFEDEPLRPADLSFVQAQTVTLGETTGPFGHRVRPDFRVVQGGRSSDGEQIGTYGVIRNAQAFVGVVVENQPEAMVDLGYLFEGFILDLTARGLGTCWLGGTFNRKTLSGRVRVNEGEVLPIITPLGYPGSHAGLQDRFMRRVAGSDRRKPFTELFFAGGFSQPLEPGAAGDWAEPLEMVRIGPSASNKQPWRVVLTPAPARAGAAAAAAPAAAGTPAPTAPGAPTTAQQAHLYLGRTPGYVGNKLGFDMQRIDIGIAMLHLERAWAANGRQGSWSFEDPGLTLPDEHTEFIATFTVDHEHNAGAGDAHQRQKGES